MLPMGWNQIRQARVGNTQSRMPYGHQNQPHMQSHPQHDWNQQPMMPPQQQMYPPHPQVMGSYGMQNPQMMMGNPPQPPEPAGPPPPSPPAPLPSNESIPPPPPDDGQWWIAEMKNLPSHQHRQELERIVNEKWFQSMTTNQQIECWQHKLQLINKTKGQSAKPSPAVLSAPPVTAPQRLDQPQQQPAVAQSGDIDRDLRSAKEEEANIKQQVVTFARQYGEWRKQFDEWKDKHRSHPNQEQFSQYESQWMTWQKQMTDQKDQYDSSLQNVRNKIQNLERQMAERQNVGKGHSNWNNPPQNQFQASQQQNRFSSSYDNNQSSYGFENESSNFNKDSGYQNDYSNMGYGPPQSINRPQNYGSNFDSTPRPRFSAPGGADNAPFPNRPPNQFQGQRQQFDHPRGNQRFGLRSGPRNFGPRGPRFRNRAPQQFMDSSNIEDYEETWHEEESYDQGNKFQQNFNHNDQNQRMRPRHPSHGPRGVQRGGRFPTPRQRPPRPTGPGLNIKQENAPKSLFDVHVDKYTGHRGPGSLFEKEHESVDDQYFNDDIPNENMFSKVQKSNTDNQHQKGRNDEGMGNKIKEEPIKEEFNAYGDKGKEKDTRVIKEEKLSEPNKTEDGNKRKEEEERDNNPENDYSHYFTDDYLTFQEELISKERGNRPLRGRGGAKMPSVGRGRGSANTPPVGRGRGSANTPPVGRGRGSANTPPVGRGRGSANTPPVGRGRGSANTLPVGRGRGSANTTPVGRGRGDIKTSPGGRGRGRGNAGIGRGRGIDMGGDSSPSFKREPSKPPHVLLREAREFNASKMKPNRDIPSTSKHFNAEELKKEESSSAALNTPSTSASSVPLDADKIMQKVKELSNIDMKNLLSAVKSIKGTEPSEKQSSGLDAEPRRERGNSLSEDALLAEELHYERLAREYEEDPLRQVEKDLLGPDSRLRESELIAAGLDPTSLGLRDEDLLLDEYYRQQGITDPLRKPMLRNRYRDPLRQVGLRDPLRNPAIRDPVADSLRDPLCEPLRSPAIRDPVADAFRDPLREPLRSPAIRDPVADVLRDPLFDPLLEDTLLERDMLIQEIRQMREREEVRQREEARREMELRMALTKPLVQTQKIVETIDYSHGLKKDVSKAEGESSNGEGPEKRRMEEFGGPSHLRDRDIGDWPGPHGFDRRYPPMSIDDRMRIREQNFRGRGLEHDFPPERMMREQGRQPMPYDPKSSFVVAEDIDSQEDALKKHWELLDREKESMERKRTSMERRRSSLERTHTSREREEERLDRERSLERLRNMERELKERERMLYEREQRLRSPPARRARDWRSRAEWKPEGSSRPRARSRSPPSRRRFQEDRSSPKRGDRRPRSGSRTRTPSPKRPRDWFPGRSAPNSVPRRRSPDVQRNRPNVFRDNRRRFTSPSGDPARTGSPAGSKPKMMKMEPVCVSVEDLLNDPARQKRPKRIVIILRGLPGSGKSHIAKLIRDKESAKGVTARLLGLDDYFMVENEKFDKDPDTGKIIKRKVDEYEYDAALEPKYRESLLKSFKKTLENGYFNFIIVDCINNKVEHFSEFWTAAKKSVFEVYVAELTADVHVCEKRNVHNRKLEELQEMANGWEETPQHMIRLDVRQMVQDSEIQEVEMGDISEEEEGGDGKKEKMTLEQLAGIPQSKWEKMEANERLDKLDGIKKKKLTSSQQDMAEFLSVTDDYVQRSSAPGKKRVRWADIEEKSTQRRLRDVGFVVGNTDWSRMVDGESHADAALNRTKFI